jgi:hypothetical protein
MHLMFGDEADKDAAKDKKFFVYGAIFVPTNSVSALHTEVERLRTAAGMAGTDTLKSGTNTKPEGMTSTAHKQLKIDVTKAAYEKGNVKLCVQVTLHELARNQKHDDRVLYGANTILAKFNHFLAAQRSHGFAVMDRIPVEKPYEYLKEKFQVGMTQNGKPLGRLDRVLGFSHGADGTSHLCSVCDILLGSFRYCVNDPKNEEAAAEMFSTLMGMMWRGRRSGQDTIREFGLCFRPLNIDAPKYQAEYDGLEARLQGYLNGKETER